MIAVSIDFTDATVEEIQRFYAMPGVGRALELVRTQGRLRGIELSLRNVESEAYWQWKATIKGDGKHGTRE
jgi:hypothetical protein